MTVWILILILFTADGKVKDVHLNPKLFDTVEECIAVANELAPRKPSSSYLHCSPQTRPLRYEA